MRLASQRCHFYPKTRYYSVLLCFALLLLLLIVWDRGGTADISAEILVSPSNREATVHSRLIPRIIHQSYRDHLLPRQYWKSVASWRKTHPDYTYFLWTDKDIQLFIRTEYPEYVSLLDSYRHKLQKVDAVRYFILYHYGGVYADMDVTALRSMDPLLDKYSCIISRERFEQTWFLWKRRESLMNAVMASAPRHPFMKFVILNLHYMNYMNFLRPPKDRMNAVYHYILATTGPLALTDLYYRYPPCQDTVPGTGVASACDVYLAEPQELLPRIMPAELRDIRNSCFKSIRLWLYLNDPWRWRACRYLEMIRYQNDLPRGAYTDHEYSHLGYTSQPRKSVWDVKTLVGKYRSYLA